jgi:hypothetical protein
VSERTSPEAKLPQPSDIVIESAASAVEIAAVTAVLSAALREQAAESLVRRSTAPSAWDRSARALRRPMARGTWSDFTA